MQNINRLALPLLFAVVVASACAPATATEEPKAAAETNAAAPANQDAAKYVLRVEGMT